MSTINYSKWDHIEISDDEDDTHPNIDTASLFRWRHQARVERMEKEKQEKEALQKSHQDTQQKMAAMKQKIKEAESKQALEDMEKIKTELSTLEKQEVEYAKKEEELRKKEKSAPWNIDTICHDGKSKTLINKVQDTPKELTDEERAEKQEVFTKKYKEEIKKFGMIRKYEDSQEYLLAHPHLACEETANYLVLWCIDLEIEEKHNLMDHVSHQTIVMQFILELAKSLKVDPRQCIRSFFSRIQMAQKEYLDAFNDELEAFKGRIRTRAKQKLDEAIKQHEEEERQKRLGPGGLDPVEVFESLPDSLKECFESKDIALLQKVIMEFPKEEAEYHMKRCVDSGLWVPNAADAAAGGGEGEVQEEEVYDEVEEVEGEK